MALQLIRFLQYLDRYLPDAGPVAHASFPSLPEVPDWLVDLVPTRSALGAFAFREDQFLIALVGVTESAYESVVLPRYTAEYLQQSQSPCDEATCYKWVVPQWSHYDFKRARSPASELRIWTLVDGLGRECWSGRRARPWE